MTSAIEKRIFRSMKNYQDRIYKILSSADIDVDTNGLPLSYILLLRLKQSFDSIPILMRKGYFIESNSICRIILEQLAYSIAIHDKSYDEIDKYR